MKEVIGLIVIIGLLMGCIFFIARCEQKQKERTINNIKTINYKGCEYLYFNGGRVIIFTHKGNCKNKIHYATK